MGPVDFALPSSIDAILDSDVDGLLDAPEKPVKVTATDRLERAFLEVVEFRRTHGRIPDSTTREIAERKLGARLDGILANEEKIAALKHLDEFGLLEVPEAPASIDDLLGDDDLDLLGDDSGLLDVSDLPVRKAPDEADSVAKRKKCLDFDRFEHLFKTKHAELADGTVQLASFKGLRTVTEGRFFVLNGVMLFVAEVGETREMIVGGKAEQKQRLRVIFENGTESSMYRQSLSIRLFEQEGQSIVQTGLSDDEEILEGDAASGHIYVLRSLSTDPQIAELTNLHKIGFTRGSVEARIKNAETSPTYLMAPVEVVADYRTYNLRASALENLLHRVFADVRLDLTQADRKGRNYDPSEWYVAPLSVIDQAIDLIISGDIVSYFYDREAQRLVSRASDNDG
ncbi:GIY-YIG nuclease family protein [Micrococcus luteus]|uniref:GIY-YIG nuclease family protein n=1 Tax=Micrococcus TaxID=1269 RepID=UPI001F23053F|nr:MULTISPECIES: GIY-YIG nuclease family protein [Micrococcus]MCV7472496.1 GIY-YIG nuclease family protein [Micrococcus luteus]MCV7487714.1 GIY-YIG nuclease family protein [Micrococcus luteus]MCV7600273.1 GIY-YIG nuclease family protein [Micrococcus luteus]